MRGAPAKDRQDARSRADYQIALRSDDLGLDDVVVKDVAMFRMERMNDNYVWLACYLADGQEIHFDLWRDKKTVRYSARNPLPNVLYEVSYRPYEESVEGAGAAVDGARSAQATRPNLADLDEVKSASPDGVS